MVKRKLPSEGSKELGEIKQRYRSGGGREIANELGMTYGSLKNSMNDIGVAVAVPPAHTPRFDKPLKLTGSWTILGEPHIPYYDASFVNNVFELSVAWGITNLLIPGDALDLSAFSVFLNKPEAKIFKYEKSSAQKFFKAAHETFDRIVLIPGNHLRRFLKWSNEQLDLEEDFKNILNIPELEISEYDYCIINDWLVTHPRNASVIPGRIPVFLLRKFGGKHVAGGHGHLGGLVYGEDGKRLGCDIGCTVDPLRLDWVAQHINTRPFMCKGSLILKEVDGKVFPYWLHDWIDWESMKHLY